jgi:hypothetical protein
MPKSFIHSVRFFTPAPAPIHSLALCKDSDKKLLALSRGNNDIEIWSLGTVLDGQGKKTSKDEQTTSIALPFLQKWIPGNSESSVEGLVWARGRLFSTGLHG